MTPRLRHRVRSLRAAGARSVFAGWRGTDSDRDAFVLWATERHPKDRYLCVRAADGLTGSDPEKAERLALTAVDLAGQDDPETTMRAACILYDLGRGDEAGQLAWAVDERGPSSAAVRALMFDIKARFAWTNEDLPAAEAAFRESLRLWPENGYTAENFAIFLAATGRSAEG